MDALVKFVQTLKSGGRGTDLKFVKWFVKFIEKWKHVLLHSALGFNDKSAC